MSSCRNLKRKAPENEGLVFPPDDLNQGILERVLSWLPTSTFLQLTSVCKRWKSAATSPTFHHACSEIPSRDPWFYMKFLSYPSKFLEEKQHNNSNFLPIAASGGLLCFHSSKNGEFLICNPVTSSCCKLPSLDYCDTLCTIGMISTQLSYKLVLSFGETPNLSFRLYNSTTDKWEDGVILSRKSPIYPAGQSYSTDDDNEEEDDNDRMLYFLSKCGNNFFEYPRLLPLHHKYSIDLVECGGKLFVVVLSEFLETTSLRVWNFDEQEWIWNQVLAMPKAISHEFYGKKVDINCTRGGRTGEHMFEWNELHGCCGVNGYSRKFSCAFSFQPRIEAYV
ncbi:unnamed protein product [Withania somnifera]